MNSPVLLDLCNKDYSDAAVCSDLSFIHRSPMERIMSIWNRLYHNVENGIQFCSGKEEHYYHNTISIFANRGAGKTTFLLYFLKKIREKHESDVLFLKPIDPSHVEIKQHPFINIIASIQEHVTSYYEKSNYVYNPRDEHFDTYKKQNDCYKKLLNALPFVDGVGKERIYEDWNDEEYISIQGMKKATASNNLEELFRVYLENTLWILKKKCLVIAFDDIDSDFKKGYQILEVIRKYLTSKLVIPIITGDLELYGKLVRKGLWECFDLDFLRKEVAYANRAKEEFADMVNQLENQYLVKILKPENRVHLKTLREYLNEKDFAIEVQLKNEEKCITLESCYKKILERSGYGTYNLRLQFFLTNFFMGLSLRIQIRLLTALNDCESDKCTLNEDLLGIFWNDINQKAVNSQELRKESENYTIEMLRFLVHNKALHTSSNFLPESHDDVMNKALFAIGTQFNHLLNQNPYLIFDYWLRISYVRIVTENLSGKIFTNEIDDFLKFTLLNTDSRLIKGLGLGQAYCNYKLNKSENQRERTIPGYLAIGENTPLQESSIQSRLSIMPMLGTINSRNQEKVFISVYQILAILYELLYNSGIYTREGKNHVFWLNFLLNQHTQYRNYIEPKDESTRKIQNNENVFSFRFFDVNTEDDKIWKDLVNQMGKWVTTSPKDISVSLLDRIFTRFYYTMTHIDEHKKASNVGEMFSRYIVALLNAVLVEQALDYHVPDIRVNHIGDDIENIFVENLKSRRKYNLGGNSNSMSLYRWFVKCPVLTMYLNPFLLNLITNEKIEKRQTFDQLYKYHQIRTSLSDLEMKEIALQDTKGKLDRAIDWLNKYEQYQRIQTDIDIAKFIIEGIKNKEIVDDEEEDSLLEKQKYLGNYIKTRSFLLRYLAPLTLEEYEITLTLQCLEDEISEYSKKIYSYHNSVHVELIDLENRISHLKQKEKDMPQLVKDDYDKFMTQNNDLQLSVYSNLSKIQL